MKIFWCYDENVRNSALQKSLQGFLFIMVVERSPFVD
jgi:hypothetical protein